MPNHLACSGCIIQSQSHLQSSTPLAPRSSPLAPRPPSIPYKKMINKPKPAIAATKLPAIVVDAPDVDTNRVALQVLPSEGSGFGAGPGALEHACTRLSLRFSGNFFYLLLAFIYFARSPRFHKRCNCNLRLMGYNHHRSNCKIAQS